MSVEIKDIENVVIVGSGPAGYTAALYTARADLEPLVIEGFAWGGLLQQTTDVENYPGYSEGVLGPEMMQNFRDQAARFGTRFITDDATEISLGQERGDIHRITVGGREIKARSVILAMGAEPKKLGVPGEDELAARGVSYCATCDAAFFRDKQTIVVGGGDTAMEDATFLAKFAGKVSVVHRRDDFRASAIMLDRARQTENIELLTPYTVERFEAGDNGSLDRAVLRNTERRLGARAADHRRLHRGRPPAELRARPGAAGDRRRGLRPGGGPLHAHRPPGRVRRRRPHRPHLPPGRDRGGHGMHVGTRRRGLPARPPDRPRGPLGPGPGQGSRGRGERGLLGRRPGGPRPRV